MTAGPRARLAARPKTSVCLFYLLLTLAGGTLLSLPQAVAPELRFEEGDYLYKRILNATFTSASAVTLTGLNIYDTGRDFSGFGQAVILALMQVGGWAALTIGGLFALKVPPNGSAGRIVGRWILYVIVVTWVMEALGTLVSHRMWCASADKSAHAWFASTFHAVSSLCNAGFTLSGDGLVGPSGNSEPREVLLLLVVFGGLGTVFWFELISGRGLRSKPVWWTLGTTAVVLALAPAVLFLTESREWRDPGQRLPKEVAALMPPVMADMAAGERARAALFLSVSARSAGFRTAALDADSLSPPGALFLCLLMFIGGAPGSMAGGVSTLALAILALRCLESLRRRPSAGWARRSLPSQAVSGALHVVLLALAIAAMTCLLLCITERGAQILEVAFEAVSAVSSSGLSMGLTPRLSVAGRVVLIVAMLAGRVLSVTVVAALWRGGNGEPLRKTTNDSDDAGPITTPRSGGRSRQPHRNSIPM